MYDKYNKINFYEWYIVCVWREIKFDQEILLLRLKIPFPIEVHEHANWAQKCKLQDKSSLLCNYRSSQKMLFMVNTIWSLYVIWIEEGVNKRTSPRRKTKAFSKKEISGEMNYPLKTKEHTFDGVPLRVAPSLEFWEWKY